MGKARGLLPGGIRGCPVCVGAHVELVAAAYLDYAAGLRALCLHLGKLLEVRGA